MNNKPIYVFGHKNPDTDSVCAAISFSYLKNKLGYNTIPAVLGDINQESKYVLDYFGFKTPHHLNDVKTQIKDVMYHRNCFIDKNSTIKDAFDFMNKYSLTGVSVVENKNKYFGYLSLKEIAWEVINGDFHKLDTSYGNIISVLKGQKILKFDKDINGEILINNDELDIRLLKGNIIITESKDIESFINMKAKLIILVNTNIGNKVLNMAKLNRINIIKTNYNIYEVGKLISLSNYVKNFVRYEADPITFNEVDYLSDFLDRTKQLKHTNYPIISNKKTCCGLLTLTDTNQIDRKKVILVDHNNFSQSVDGIEEADILEVIDHHSIGDIVTKKPINFRSSLCGSVCTMIYEMYQENNVKIPSKIAGLLMSAIISDTLLLSSPTATSRDKDALISLSKIAKVDYRTYGIEMLKQGMSISGLSNEDLLYRDFKTYKIDDETIGIGQLLVSDINKINKKFNELSKYLNDEAKKHNYKVLTLFITDFFDNKSYCLYNINAQEVIKNAFNLEKIYEGVVLSGVLSRKVQIAPYIMSALEK